MSIHIYTKALYQKTVKDALLGDTLFMDNCKSVCIIGSDNISIEFNLELSGSEKLRLDGIIAGLSQVDSSVMIASNMEKITKFTEKLIRDFGEKNLKRGYTGDQIRSLTSKLSEVMALLQGKALPTVLEVLAETTPSAELTLEDISEFTNDIMEFLSSL